jgi:hypothetical protein
MLGAAVWSSVGTRSVRTGTDTVADAEPRVAAEAAALEGATPAPPPSRPRRVPQSGAPSAPKPATDALLAGRLPPVAETMVDEGPSSPAAAEAGDGGLSGTTPASPFANDVERPGAAASTPAAPADVGDALAAADEAAIRALIRAFEAAFAGQSTPELRRLQPSLDSRQLALYDSRFLGSKAFAVEFSDLRLRATSPQRVVVACSIERDITLDDDSHRRHTGRATLVVEHDGERWRITGFRPPIWW